jgi:cytochrome b involved in lipid metabolism
MSNNKKFTLSIIALVLLVGIFGSIKGYKDYSYNKVDVASQNVGSGEKCIITIQGAQYDVTEFKTKHPGGDVFKCGQDMTKAFQGAHKGYLPMIEKFKVN